MTNTQPALTNKFDRMEVDLESVAAKVPYEIKNSSFDPLSLGEQKFLKLYRSPFLSLKARNQLWHLCHRSSIDWNWLERFRPYWSQVLGGRPLWGPQDLFYLRNSYRSRFQHFDAGDLENAQAHVAAWQKSGILYLLLDLVYREGLANESKILDMLKKHCVSRRPRVMEYGCSTAPVATTLFEFDRLENYDVTLVDIPTICLHYAAYKFQAWPNVRVTRLEESNDLQLDLAACGTFDAIFCITVFEHLNQPFETMKRFHQALRPGGLLFFDYILGEADGLDTKQGQEQRKEVLRWAQEKFTLLHGNWAMDETMNLTLIQKR